MRPRRLFRPSAFVLILSLAWPAWAEPSSESIKMARRRFQEGVAAADAGNYEAARVAFQQAYTLKPHPSVLRNLGQAELKTAHYLEAARHLSAFLRDTNFGSSAERDSAKKSLTIAETKIAKISVEVDVDGADITIDGEPVGRSPMTVDPYYVEPGQRVVRIQKDGFAAYDQSHNLEAGRAQQLKIVLRGSGTSAAAVPLAEPTTVHSSPPELGLDPVAPSAPSPALPPDAPVSKSGGSSTRTVALVALGGAAAISAGIAVGYGLKWQSRQSQEDDLLNDLRKRAGDSPCPAAGADCARLNGLADERASAFQVACVGAAVFVGSFAAGAVVLATGGGRQTAGPWIAPIVTADQRGIGWGGSF